jgi:hypothetical protein
MMSSTSTPDFRASSLRRPSRRPATPSFASSSTLYGPSTSQPQQSIPQPSQSQTTVAPPQATDALTTDPTFEPLERAGRAINDGIRKDDRFPELDQLVQRKFSL